MLGHSYRIRQATGARVDCSLFFAKAVPYLMGLRSGTTLSTLETKRHGSNITKGLD